MGFSTSLLHNCLLHEVASHYHFVLLPSVRPLGSTAAETDSFSSTKLYSQIPSGTLAYLCLTLQYDSDSQVLYYFYSFCISSVTLSIRLHWNVIQYLYSATLNQHQSQLASLSTSIILNQHHSQPASFSTSNLNHIILNQHHSQPASLSTSVILKQHHSQPASFSTTSFSNSIILDQHHSQPASFSTSIILNQIII